MSALGEGIISALEVYKHCTEQPQCTDDISSQIPKSDAFFHIFHNQ